MVTTEGIGGPCPRCGGEKCFMRKGSPGWYRFVACADCFFAYGEQAGTMKDHTGGVVTGADVWSELTEIIDTTDPDNILEDYDPEEEEGMDPWYDFSEVDEHKLDWMIVSDIILETLLKTEGVRIQAMEKRLPRDS